MSNIHEEEALGKAYDSRLLKRLMQYMRPYRWRVALALALVAVVTPLELAPPMFFQVAIDKFFVPWMRHSVTKGQVERGTLLICAVFLAVLIFDFLAQYVQLSLIHI